MAPFVRPCRQDSPRRQAWRPANGAADEVAATLASAAPAILAQTPAKRLRKIGYLNQGVAPESGPWSQWSNPYAVAFRDELKRLGWVVDKDYTYHQRWVQGDPSSLEKAAAELATEGVEVLSVAGDAEALASLRGAPKLPIVVCVGLDPIGNGYAKSLARPGGNVTGLAWEQDVRIVERHVQLIKEYVPEMKRLGLLTDPNWLGLDKYVPVEAEAARRLGMTLHVVEVSKPDGIEAAFAALVKANVQALFIHGSTMMWQERQQVASLVRRHRLPDIGVMPEVADLGGLMSYAVDLVDMYRRSSGYVDKILRGAKPADLPMEQPTKYDLVINLKTAKELGRPVPKTLLAQATRLIE